jgi:enoyl-CoA hydratase/carnithine racemase
LTESPRELASGKLLLDEPAPGATRLRINNPSRRGALDHEILDTLAETVRGLDARCLLLTGTEKVFSAGYDLGNLEGQSFEESAEKLVAHPFHEAIEALDAFAYPVVGALNGHAIGGGLELALTCDIRLAASGIKVGMPPAKLGLIYSHTGLRKFLEVCGPANTSELFHAGRNVDTDRALQMGLVNRVVDPAELEEESVELAGEIAANAPLALKGNKRIIRVLREQASRLPEELERELVDLRESCFRTEDFREGVKAFGEKRAPQWRGR